MFDFTFEQMFDYPFGEIFEQVFDFRPLPEFEKALRTAFRKTGQIFDFCPLAEFEKALRLAFPKTGLNSPPQKFSRGAKPPCQVSTGTLIEHTVIWRFAEDFAVDSGLRMGHPSCRVVL